MAINAKMLKFCAEYAATRDKEQAAINAGYAKKTAAKKADELLCRKDILDKIKQLDSESIKQLAFAADTITLRYIDIYRACSKIVPRQEWDTKSHSYVPSKTVFEMVDAKNALAALDAIAERLNIDSSAVTSDTVKALYEALRSAEIYED